MSKHFNLPGHKHLWFLWLPFSGTALVKPIGVQWHINAPVNMLNNCSGNGLAPIRRQAITWTNTALSSTGTLGTNFSDITIRIWSFSTNNMRLKTSSVKRQPFCFGRVWVPATSSGSCWIPTTCGTHVPRTWMTPASYLGHVSRKKRKHSLIFVDLTIVAVKMQGFHFQWWKYAY